MHSMAHTLTFRIGFLVLMEAIKQHQVSSVGVGGLFAQEHLGRAQKANCYLSVNTPFLVPASLRFPS